MRADSNFQPQITPESFNAYLYFLRSKGFDEAFFEKYDSVTLIDRTESGNSLKTLEYFLSHINNRFVPSITVHSIGIVGAHSKKLFSFPTILMGSEMLRQTSKKHDSEQVNNVSLPFHPEDWTNWQNFEFYPTPPFAPAQARLDQVQEYVSTRHLTQ